jgi:hypothetical protein
MAAGLWTALKRSDLRSYYRDNPFEVEALAAACRTLLRNRVCNNRIRNSRASTILGTQSNGSIIVKKLTSGQVLRRLFARATAGATALVGTTAVLYAATATVPGTHSTIQAAITAVQGTSGALVTVNSNATFAENIVTDAVDLVAGVGFSPTIRPPSGNTISITTTGAAAQSFTLRGLRIEDGGSNSADHINVSAGGTGSLTLNIDRVQISNPLGGVATTGINLRSTTPTAAKTINLTDSTISLTTTNNQSSRGVFMAEGGALSVARSRFSNVGNFTAFDIRGSDTQPITFSLVDSVFNIAAPIGPYSSMLMDLINAVTSDIRRNTFNFIGDSQGSVSGILIRYITAGRTHTISQNQFVGTGLRAGSGVNLVPFAGGFSGTPGPQSVTAVVTNNLMRNLESGISANPQTPGDTATVIALNNTIDSSNACLSLSANDGTTINGRFNNNLCTNIAGAVVPPGQGPGFVIGAIGAFAGTGSTISMTFSNNGFFNNPNGNYSPTVAGVSSVGVAFDANPLYANPGAADFRLSFGSPAIDSGLTEASVTTDYNNAARPQAAAYDIGAFEGGVVGLAQLNAPVPTLGTLMIGLLALLLAAGAAGGLARSARE